MKRRLVFCLSLVLFGLVGSSITSTLGQESVTVQSAPATPLKLNGLKERVTIRRDERGIPYIEAKNDNDLYFAQGYVTASDRLWQMDLFRRNARGELAEIFPSLGATNQALEEDKRHRTFGFAQVAEAEAAQASPQTRARLEAFASGVNAYIASLDAKSLPAEFKLLGYKPRPWTPADSVVVSKILYETLSSSWRLDVMREALSDLPAAKRAWLLAETSPLDVLVVGKDSKSASIRSLSPKPSQLNSLESSALLTALARDQEIESRSLARVGLYAEALAASNNWVVSGKHTVSGKPLLANDPHLAASAPSIWYMVHLTAPGVRVSGVTLAGIPGVIIGHNDHIAWGLTNVGADVQDVYVEKFDPTNPHRYQTPTGWRDAEIRHEEIKVRKGPTDASTDVVPLDVVVTRHGPIVLERNGRSYSLHWTALDPRINNPDPLYALDRARNWNEFTGALKGIAGPMQNGIYADIEGHIGYYAAAAVPIRKSGDGSVPYDGSTDDGEWSSYIPFDKLPHLYDPPTGIIVTANQRIVGTDYPYHLTHAWAQPYRARRILDLLNEKPKLTADDFRAIQGDVYSIAGVAFTRAVAKTLKGKLTTPDDEKLSQAVTDFEAWDGKLTVDSRVAPLASEMRIAFRTKIINSAIGEERARTFGWSTFDSTLDRIVTEQPSDWLPKEFQGYDGLLKACFTEARQALTKRFGADETQWTWGNRNKVTFPHPLANVPFIGMQFAIAPFPQGGTPFLLGATVNVGSAVSMRLIADPGDWDKSQHGIALGESGISINPHWSDQLADWRAVTPHVFPFTEGAIAKATKETLVLEPGK